MKAKEITDRSKKMRNNILHCILWFINTFTKKTIPFDTYA